MKMRMLSCFVILLITLAHVDARHNAEQIPMVEDQLPYVVSQPSVSICESCMKPSKIAEGTSRDSNLVERLVMISAEVCQILPFDSKSKCIDTSDAYIHRTKLLMNGIFNEETLCNSTGLCLLKSVLSATDGLASVGDNLEVAADDSPCNSCRKSVKDIFVRLNQPRLRMRVMESLIDYCEDIEYNVKECKQKVYTYAPLVLSKLEKLKTTEFCRMMGLCDEGML